LPVALENGQQVLCCYESDGYFYPGVIKLNAGNQSIVLSNMNIEQDLSRQLCIPIDSSSSMSILFATDHVLVRQTRNQHEYWAPGIIRCLPTPISLPKGLYRVEIYDPTGRSVRLTSYPHHAEHIDNLAYLDIRESLRFNIN
jgi:hypothetical protein